MAWFDRKPDEWKSKHQLNSRVMYCACTVHADCTVISGYNGNIDALPRVCLFNLVCCLYTSASVLAEYCQTIERALLMLTSLGKRQRDEEPHR